MRKDLIVMKRYFMECPSAKETHLLKRLDEFPHFKDGAKRFSLADLMAVHDDSLLPRLRPIHQEFAMHIKRECKVSGRGRGVPSEWRDKVSIEWEGQDISSEWEGQDISSEWEGQDISSEWEGRDISSEWEGQDISSEWEGQDISSEWEGLVVH